MNRKYRSSERGRKPSAPLIIPFSEAARKLHICRTTLRKRIRSGEIKAVSVGPRLFVPQAELDRIVSGVAVSTVAQQPSADQQEAQSASVPEAYTGFDAVLAEVEAQNIFAGPKADDFNRVLAKAECSLRSKPLATGGSAGFGLEGGNSR